MIKGYINAMRVLSECVLAVLFTVRSARATRYHVGACRCYSWMFTTPALPARVWRAAYNNAAAGRAWEDFQNVDKQIYMRYGLREY